MVEDTLKALKGTHLRAFFHFSEIDFLIEINSLVKDGKQAALTCSFSPIKLTVEVLN